MSFPATSPVVQIYAGDTYTQTYLFKDSAGDPIDLVDEGWEDWKAQYRTSRPAITAYDFTVNDTDADQGILVVSMSKEDTAKLVYEGVWDLQAVRGAELKTFITSVVEVEKDVTRA